MQAPQLRQSSQDASSLSPVLQPSSLGNSLKRERELRQLSLEELSQTTRIPLQRLRQIEADRWNELPGDVFVRGFLKSYAQSLNISPQPVLDAYERRGQSKPQQAASFAPLNQPERGRRFGVAIALTIMLILFTLALSIVLRPRRKNVPMDLALILCPAHLPSHAPPSCGRLPTGNRTWS